MTEPSPSTSDPVNEYRGRDIVVRFDPRLCTKAAHCGGGLPIVFRAGQVPWADPDAASADVIATVIHKCPSGALTYERIDGGPQEEIDDEVSIRPRKNGPLEVRGPVTLLNEKGEPVPTVGRFALCRCGHSENKPFCDDSHTRVRFRTTTPRQAPGRALPVIDADLRQ